MKKHVKTGIEEKPWCKTCHKRNNHISTARKYQQCNYINHKKCSKIKANSNIGYYECLADTFGLTSIDEAQLQVPCFNSNFICKCLKDNKYTTALKTCMKQLPNLQELNLSKNCDHVNKDLIGSIANPVTFYITHEFHNLDTNIKASNLDNLSLLHTNICSLQGNIDN